ncbi:hypothetical protein ADUPG1_004031, partial [Aduncisulcus paluster]
LDFGDGGTGWQFKYLTRGGGYYFNVGCSDLVASGAVALKQFSDIETFVSEGARLKNGETVEADLIPGLWFIAGSLAQCRINSRYLALQIKAIEASLLPRDVGPLPDGWSLTVVASVAVDSKDRVDAVIASAAKQSMPNSGI